jgi:hypothetical protein
MLAGGFVGRLREAADQLLEDRPHLCVRHAIGMQVDLAHSADHLVEKVRVLEPIDLLVELELLHDLPRETRVAVDVGAQVVCQVPWIVE